MKIKNKSKEAKGMTNRFDGNTREPKQYRSPFMRSIHGESLAVRMWMTDENHFDTSESWVKLNGPTLMGLGYLPAKDYKTTWPYVFTPVYIKFEGFHVNPCLRVDPESKKGELMEVETLETASTLHDYFVSETQQDFINGMKAKGIGSINTKRLMVLGVVLVGVMMGLMYFLNR